MRADLHARLQKELQRDRAARARAPSDRKARRRHSRIEAKLNARMPWPAEDVLQIVGLRLSPASSLDPGNFARMPASDGKALPGYRETPSRQHWGYNGGFWE
jgi:hypothetical protein